MTCRHAPGDPACSSHPTNVVRQANARAQHEIQKAQAKVADLLARTPNPEVFEVIETEQVGSHLVMMVQYTSCKKCSHDAKKILVYEDVTLKNAIKWRTIDPHFGGEPKDDKTAPSPIARFPATKDGWDNALKFAKMVQGEPHD